jgi:RsiW-degrading membrane proteinase PrsW (M82 family)
MIARMRSDPIHWKQRVDAFEREQRRPLKWLLIFAAWYVLVVFALVYVARFGLDMRGHDPSEEPIRNFLYSSIRSFFFTAFPLRFADRLPAPLDVLFAWGIFLGSALAFGFLATLLPRGFRRATPPG